MGTTWDMVNPEMVMIGTEDGSETGDAKELVDHTNNYAKRSKYIIGTWTNANVLKFFIIHLYQQK